MSLLKKMISQDPKDRIYPVEKIAIQVAALQSKEQEKQTLIELAKPRVSQGFQDIPVPTVLKAEYKNKTLYLHLENLDNYYSHVWFGVLQGGHYSHNSMVGYEPCQLSLSGNTISLPIRSPNENLVQNIAQVIPSWIQKATDLFNEQQRKALWKRKMDEEKKIQDEINRIKAESAVNDKLGTLF